MSIFQNFLYKWVLIPEENKYEVGNAPLEGSYTISVKEGNTLRFDMAWTDVNNEKHTMFYFTEADGEMHEYENPSIAEYVQTTLVSPKKLESRTYKDGIEIAYAMREVIDEGKKLLVVQEGPLPSGKKFSNRSTYKRV